ncbi:DUF4190 domain-containing protein [Mariniblastus fucicola]|nr:DUF4190 domain-containing protein [Mariniblastus fucicola]
MVNANRIDPRVARQEAQTDLTSEPLPSIAAGVSWMFGLVSIPLIFVPPTAVITGFLAIVFGHIAKFQIARKQELSGERSATNGLLMGYLCFFAALALLPSIRMQSAVTQGLINSYRGVSDADGNSAFGIAERDFLDGDALSTGNTPDAQKIAAELASLLNEQRDEIFTGPRSHEIRTLCQIGDTGFCIVVLVPDLTDFDQNARDAMLNFIWKESQRLAFGAVSPGEEVAVGVRDRLQYHSMEFGRATLSPDRIAQPDAAFVDATMLDPFFVTTNPPPEEPTDDERE